MMEFRKRDQSPELPDLDTSELRRASELYAALAQLDAFGMWSDELASQDVLSLAQQLRAAQMRHS